MGRPMMHYNARLAWNLGYSRHIAKADRGGDNDGLYIGDGSIWCDRLGFTKHRIMAGGMVLSFLIVRIKYCR